MFERDLRSWCKEKKYAPQVHSRRRLTRYQCRQYKFDSSGLTRRRDAARIAVRSERHLFQLVGLPYIDPIYRNCDY
jgi:DNA polymerase IV